MRVSRKNDALRIKVGNRELKGVDYLKHPGSVLVRECHCTRGIKVKEAFNINLLLFTSKLNIELRKKLVLCYVWSTVLYGSETWTLKKLEQKYLERFEMWCWRRMNNKVAREFNS